MICYPHFKSRPGTFAIIFSNAIVFLMIVTGCSYSTNTKSGGGITPSRTPLPAANSTATGTPPPTPTGALPSPTSGGLTPSPTQTISQTTTLEQSIILTSINMLSPLQGWATGQINGLCENYMGCVLRTADGGIHWQNVTPPGITTGIINTAYFNSPKNAWVAVTPPTAGTLTIYRTSDGGQTWEWSMPISSTTSGPSWLYFTDAMHGWLMSNLGAGGGSNAVEIFTSVDGGINWKAVSQTSPAPDETTPDSLPLTCIKTGITFIDDSTGWATADCAGGDLFFYTTHDSGATWRIQALHPPKGYPQNLFSNCECATYTPHFINPEDGFMRLVIYQQTLGEYLYITHDGGKTWESYQLPLEQVLGIPEFIDSKRGWVTDGLRLFFTQDGGQSWTETASFPTGNVRGSLDFVDSERGFFTDGEQLYLTGNGGQDWTAIQPKINIFIGPF